MSQQFCVDVQLPDNNNNVNKKRMVNDNKKHPLVDDHDLSNKNDVNKRMIYDDMIMNRNEKEV